MKKIRKTTLKALIDERAGGNVAEFCRMYDLNDTYIRPLAKPLSKKSFGEKTARSLEKKIGLPEGYLDGQQKPNGRDEIIRQIEALLHRADFLTDEDRAIHIQLLEARKKAAKAN